MVTKKTTAPASASGAKSSTSPQASAAKLKTTAPTATQNPTEPKPNKVRRKELVERIVASTGKKPNEVKSVLDGVLLELGNALSAGEDLDLHPFGKVTVNRQKKFDDREVLVCKIRRKVPAELPKTDLKTAAE